MKFTEGAFRDWDYGLATAEFRTVCVRSGPHDGPPVEPPLKCSEFAEAIIRHFPQH